MLGHARIHDLTQAFASRAPRHVGNANGDEPHEDSTGTIESGAQLKAVLARLIRAEIIETVREDTFRSPSDMHQEITQEITKTEPGERISAKERAELEKKVAERYRVFRDKGQELKRWLDQSQGPVNKRRKLANGKATNGNYYEESVPDFNVRRTLSFSSSLCRGSNQHAVAKQDCQG